MTRWAMVIDHQKCVGCGGCIIGCKTENNTPEGIYWSYKITETVGTFPNVRYHYIPTLCNHCANAPCVRGCPTQALHKTETGITMHNPDKCIGCKYCMFNCPYGVIYFNWRKPHPQWQENETLIEGATSTAQEMVSQVDGYYTPYYNPERDSTLDGVRPKGVVEKCTFCDHRLQKGLMPACVEACPAEARIFGDLDNPSSSVSRLLGKYRSYRLREHLGTQPKIYYIRSFNPGTYGQTKGEVS